MSISNSMPIGPVGQQPVNPINDASAETNVSRSESSQPQNVESRSEQPAAANSPVSIATQLIQDARAAKSAGNEPSLNGHLGNLVDAVTSQMGVDNLPDEQRQNAVARLADDPVVKSLIG